MMAKTVSILLGIGIFVGVSKRRRKCQQKKKKPTIVIVDPISSGAVLAQKFIERGCEVIKLASPTIPLNLFNFVPARARDIEYAHSLQINRHLPLDEALDLVVKELRALKDEYPIKAVLAGTETGVEICDAVGERLGLLGNGQATSAQRRDKYLMQKRIKDYGLRAIKQSKANQWSDVVSFIQELNPEPFCLVMKPINSAGSDMVTCCRSLESAKETFNKIFNSTNVLGTVNKSVLVQECLNGTEYVIDTVSRQGIHKVVSIWEYEKRRENGHDFVYFSTKMISGKTEEGRTLTDYICKVLDALNIVNSPGHAEVMLTNKGPCLIEVGARPHGGEASWLPMAEALLNYDQLGVTVTSVLDPASFKRTPFLPEPKGFCIEAIMVSRQKGILKSMPRWREIEGLPSYHSRQLECKIGHHLAITSNYLTVPGSVIFISDDETQLKNDYQIYRKKELQGFFLLEN